MDVRTAVQQGAALLEAGSVPVSRFTAELLLCHALRCERPYLFAYPERVLSDLERLHYGRYLHERLKGKPTQYITRRQEFFGREFKVNEAVLIPRPETEHVVETALELARGAQSILDVGCGSGAIAVTLSLEMRRRVMASDISQEALAVARENARRLAACVDFHAGDVTEAVRARSLDLLVSNPPYIPIEDQPGVQPEVRDFEPALALYGGPGGLDVYRRLIGDARRVLRPGGWLIMEMDFRQNEPIRSMLSDGWAELRTVRDLAGLDRVTAARTV